MLGFENILTFYLRPLSFICIGQKHRTAQTEAAWQRSNRKMCNQTTQSRERALTGKDQLLSDTAYRSGCYRFLLFCEWL